MIEFIKAPLTDEVKNLLKRLEPNYPADKVVLEIDKNFATLVKCIYNKELIGILVLKQYHAYNGEKVLVIEHGVACPDQALNFSKMLSQTIFSYAHSLGFDVLEQHADTLALVRLYEKFYGEPKEYIFKKDLKLWAKEAQAHQLARQQQAQQRT